MCGICGVVAFGRPAERRPSRALAAELDNRGPDSERAWSGACGASLDVELQARIFLYESKWYHVTTHGEAHRHPRAS